MTQNVLRVEAEGAGQGKYLGLYSTLNGAYSSTYPGLYSRLMTQARVRTPACILAIFTLNGVRPSTYPSTYYTLAFIIYILDYGFPCMI